MNIIQTLYASVWLRERDICYTWWILQVRFNNVFIVHQTIFMEIIPSGEPMYVYTGGNKYIAP